MSAAAELLLVLAAAGFLILFGVRQAAAAFLLLPSGPTLTAMRMLAPVPPAALDRLIADQEASLAVRETPAGWSNLGLALALRRSATGDGDGRGRRDAVLALIRSLRMAPANPFAWTRLTALVEEVPAQAGRALLYWRQAELTGPNEPRLRVARIRLALPLWNDMTGADRDLLFQDIRRAWPTYGDDLCWMAVDPFPRALIRSSMVADLPKLLAFERSFAKIPASEKR